MALAPVAVAPARAVDREARAVDTTAVVAVDRARRPANTLPNPQRPWERSSALAHLLLSGVFG